MAESLPDCIIQGEKARLFPVLSTTSKEGRTTSIVLACLAKIDELGRELLLSTGNKVGSRAKIETYTEIVPKKRPGTAKDRPDGLIVLRIGSKVWSALVEAKVGSTDLASDQIERYRMLAKDNAIDCVVTLSNQFSTRPDIHPIEAVRKSRSKIPVVHWSWMHILTTADLLINRGDVADVDQRILLNELRRFLSHDSAGVKGFDRMPKEWTSLNKLVASGGVIAAKSTDAPSVLDAWHQETRDLSLILSRMTETNVRQKLSRKHLAQPALRQKEELRVLREDKCLQVSLSIPDAPSSLDVVADLSRRAIDVGMSLRAPEDKKSTSARVNWLLRQITQGDIPDLYVRISWPGTSAPTQHLVSDLRENVDAASDGKEHLAPTGFHLFESKKLGPRFSQQTNFIVDIETRVPAFYGTYGSTLKSWKKPSPKLKTGREDPSDVTPEALAEDADAFKT